MSDPFFNEKRMAFRLFIAPLTKDEVIKLIADLYKKIEYEDQKVVFKRTGCLNEN